MNNCKVNEPIAKKSLMNALENLERKASALVDFFNLVADRIDNVTHRIGNNIEQIRSIIE